MIRMLTNQIIRIIALSLLVSTALAQSSGTVPNHAIPIGKGPGVSGFGFVTPGSTGDCLISNGTSSDPSFQACAGGILPIIEGGTGATTAPQALLNLGALPLAGGSMTGLLTLSANPTINLGAATKQYVDSLAAGLAPKVSVVVATTTNGTLATAYENGDTIDGVVLATGNRILIKNQSAQAENGIYTVNASGAPTRATDLDIWTEAIGAFTFVSGGTTNIATGWVAAVTSGGTINVTALPFTQYSASSVYSAGSGLVLTGAVFSADTGTSGHKLPFLDIANTWSAQQVYNASPSAVQFYGTGPNPGITFQNDTNPGSDGYASYIFYNQRDLAGTLWRGGLIGPGFLGATPNALYFDFDIAGYTNSVMRTLSYTGIAGYGARTATISIASPAVITLNAHGYIANTSVKFNVYATGSGTLPTGLVAGTLYYVLATGLTANSFQVSATLGGAAINTSGTQSGTQNVISDKLATTTFLTLDALGYSRLGAPGQGWSTVVVENAFDNTLPPEIIINDAAQAATAGMYRLVSSGSLFQIQKNTSANGDFSIKTSIAFPSGDHTAAMLDNTLFTGATSFENFLTTDDTSGLITLGRFSSSGAGLWSLLRASALSNGIEFRDNPGNRIVQLSTVVGVGLVDVFGTVRTGSTAFALRSSVTMSNGAGSSSGTLTNSPGVGNPTKWVPYDDNGTTRYIPMW